MGLIDAQDGAARKRKKADVMEIIDDTNFEDHTPPSQNIIEAPLLQFETNMIDDSTASGAKKKKKNKKKLAKRDDEDDEEETLITS